TLEGDINNPRVVGVFDKSINVTTKLKKYSKQKVKELLLISGYILKSKSPTCGMERVTVYQGKKTPRKSGVGIYSKVLMNTFPALPVEEEGRLNDPALRENFFERVFLYRRWQELVENKITAKDIVAFHTCIKLSLMAHNVNALSMLRTKSCKSKRKKYSGFL
ncbi:unnamed protein product, partial [marine sediment metagenome]